MSGRLLWLPSALKAAGLKVNTVGGWETRGKPQMHPKVVVLHHTAAPPGRNAPSLQVVIDGRSDLPGPLCHVLIGRDGVCHVIASGRAHHAGTGQWFGVTGNSNAIGIEVENVGTPAEPWKPALVETMVRCAAACADAADIPPRMVCGHKEWAPRRKVDPHSLSLDDIRARIDRLLSTPDEEHDMAPHVERILAGYRRVRGDTYEPRIKDANGWDHWMEKLQTAKTADERNGVVFLCLALLAREAGL